MQTGALAGHRASLTADAAVRVEHESELPCPTVVMPIVEIQELNWLIEWVRSQQVIFSETVDKLVGLFYLFV